MFKIEILGVKVANITMQQAIEAIKNTIDNSEKKKMYFVNADCLNKVWKDSEYKQILNKTDFIFGDGSGVRLASKILDNEIIDNINGTDMLPLLCRQCENSGHSIFLLGAKPGVAEKVKQNLEEKFPDLKIAGFQHGYFDLDKENEEVISKINNSKADILLVAFGAPDQEKWIHSNFKKLKPNVSIGVGGLLDFFSGNMPRAPKWMRSFGIEWIYRLLQEPGRMWKRYILGNPLFIYRVYKWKKEKGI